MGFKVDVQTALASMPDAQLLAGALRAMDELETRPAGYADVVAIAAALLAMAEAVVARASIPEQRGPVVHTVTVVDAINLRSEVH